MTFFWSPAGFTAAALEAAGTLRPPVPVVKLPVLETLGTYAEVVRPPPPPPSFVVRFAHTLIRVILVNMDAHSLARVAQVCKKLRNNVYQCVSPPRIALGVLAVSVCT